MITEKQQRRFLLLQRQLSINNNVQSEVIGLTIGGEKKLSPGLLLE
jgi:hypothetical protein